MFLDLILLTLSQILGLGSPISWRSERTPICLSCRSTTESMSPILLSKERQAGPRSLASASINLLVHTWLKLPCSESIRVACKWYSKCQKFLCCHLKSHSLQRSAHHGCSHQRCGAWSFQGWARSALWIFAPDLRSLCRKRRDLLLRTRWRLSTSAD